MRALSGLGNQIFFFEPDAYDRQQNRDIADPEWARVIVYDPADFSAVERHLAWSRGCDVVVKASGVGVLDEFLENCISLLPSPICKVFWDVDAPATLERLEVSPNDPFHAALRRFDLVLTYGGGEPVTTHYRRLGAAECVLSITRLTPMCIIPSILIRVFLVTCPFWAIVCRIANAGWKNSFYRQRSRFNASFSLGRRLA